MIEDIESRSASGSLSIPSSRIRSAQLGAQQSAEAPVAPVGRSGSSAGSVFRLGGTDCSAPIACEAGTKVAEGKDDDGGGCGSGTGNESVEKGTEHTQQTTS